MRPKTVTCFSLKFGLYLCNCTPLRMNFFRCLVVLGCICHAGMLHARGGYKFSMISANYIQQYDFRGGFFSGAEVVYDRGTLSRVTRSPYFAAGLSGIWSGDYNYNEYSFKTCWGPARWIWNMSRMFPANPYFFCAGELQTRTDYRNCS